MSKIRSDFHVKEMGSTLGEEKETVMTRRGGNEGWFRPAGVEGISERQNCTDKLL